MRHSFLLIMLAVSLWDRPAAAQTLFEKVVEDFNGEIKKFSTGPKDLSFEGPGGHRFGTWTRDSADQTQTCTATFSDDDAVSKGRSLRIYYDVDSPNPAFNGFYLKLDGLDLSGYDMLHLYLRGDLSKGFTPHVKIELKNGHQAHVRQKELLNLPHEPFLGSHTFSAFLEGIGADWRKFSIPFSNFRKLKELHDMHELVIVFDDIHSSPKSGVIYLDHISLSKSGKP